MKARPGIVVTLVAAASVSAYSLCLAGAPNKAGAKFTLTKAEKMVRQIMSDAHREKRSFTQSEAKKLVEIASRPVHEAHEAAVALLTLGTPEQQLKAREQAFRIALTKTNNQRLYAILSLYYAKDLRWKTIAQSIPESDSGYECTVALLNDCN
jgi:hypothetical protein